MTSNISAIWANDGEDKVTQDELRLSHGGNVANSIWQGGAVTLFGAKNEVVQFNLVLEAATTAAASVSVTLSSLTGPSGSVIRSAPRAANNLFNWTGTEAELFYVRYVPIHGLSGFGYTVGGGANFELQIPAKLRLPLVGGVYTGGWSNRPNHDKFHPEIAVPLELVPTFPIAAGNNQSIWADIYIPKTAARGAYTGTVTVKEGGVVTHTVPVTLTVRNFVLPDIPSSKTMVWSGYPQVALRYTGEGYPIVGSAHDILAVRAGVNQRRVMHRHKISIMGDDEWTTNGNANGTERSPGPAYVPFLTGTAFTAANGYAGPGAGVGNGVYSIGTYGQWGWAATQAAFWAAADAWESWFQANSPTTERFVYLSDESSNFAQTEQWANWMKTNPGAGKSLKSMATVSAIDAASVPSLNIPTGLFYAGVTATWQNAVTAIETAPGKEYWMYNTPRPGAGAFSTECDGTDLREKPWGQYKKGVARWFFWDATNWQLNGSGASIDVFNQAQTWGSSPPVFDPVYGMTGGAYSNGDGLLLYPGTDAIFPASSYGISGPIASLRLKYWRRGVQDVDYLTLAAAINPASVTALVQTMVPQALWELPITDPNDPTYYTNLGPSWSDNPDVWESARAQLASIIEGSGAAVPVNTAIPAITGTAQVGQTLTGTNGTWTNSPASYTYQWNRAGTPVGGATAATYIPVAADVGNRLTISVTAANVSGPSSPATSNATAAVIAATVPIPVNITLPFISGTAKVGQTLTASTGTWTNSPTSYVYQWRGNGTNITGATASTYVPVAGDVGHTLTVSVVATNSSGSSAAAVSAATAAVAAAAAVPVNTYSPYVSGRPQVGNPLDAVVAAWTNNPTSYTYKWTRNGVIIAGATASQYHCVAADQGTLIGFIVTAYNAAGASLPANSSYLVQ